MSTRHHRLKATVIIALLTSALVAPTSLSHATITTTGNVTPSPSGTTSSQDLYIARTSDGSMLVNGGSDVLCRYGQIGFESWTAGEASITGTGSTWTATWIAVGAHGEGVLNVTSGGMVVSNSGKLGSYNNGSGVVTIDGTNSTWSTGQLDVGYSGDGSLTISNGGIVNVTSITSIRSVQSANGEVTFNNGTLNTAGLYAAVADLYGTGTINTGGLISDIDLIFDQNHGPQQQLLLNNLPDQNITINLNLDSTQDLGVGYAGQAKMTITDGRVITSRYGRLGMYAGSHGAVTVTGTGSRWSISDEMRIGYYGEATLNIANGGSVSSGYTYVGFYSEGETTVDGSGSSWTTTSLYLGYDSGGTGVLRITNGGQVFTGNGYLGGNAGSGYVTVDGVGSTWTGTNSLQLGGFDGYGSLIVTNGGKVVVSGSGIIAQSSGSSGDVIIDGPGSLWTTSGRLAIGNDGNGTLTVTNGGHVGCGSYVMIGSSSGSSGALLIDGSDSVLEIESNLTVGNNGQGSLTLANGAQLNVPSDTWVGRFNSSSSIHFDNGALTTISLYAGVSEMSGSGVINVHGLVSDVDLIFDQSHGLQKQFLLHSLQGLNITINLDHDATGALGVGYAGDASLMITDGQVINSTSGYVGYKTGSHGTAIIDGAGSTWNLSELVYVGGEGSGSLTIRNGAQLVSKGGIVDDVTVDNAAWHLASTGTVTASGGMLTIMNGGQVTGGNSGIISDSGNATVTGEGSLWEHQYYTYVGRLGEGTLSITNGGVVHNMYDGMIGFLAGSSGVVTVDGTDSKWLTGHNLNVGSYISGATGKLTIQNNGTVTVADTLILASGLGTIYLNGGMLTAGTIIVNAGTFNFTSGTLRFDQYTGTLNNRGGTLAPGQSPGNATITGNYTQTAGALAIELTANDAFDKLTVTGNAALNGSLTVELLDDFTPNFGQTFTILTASGGVTGTFEFLSPIFNDVNYFDVIYQSNAVLLEVLAHTHAGDANEDNIINLADLQVIGDHWQSTSATWATGDFTGDGIVNLADLQILGDNWGFGTSPDLTFADALQLAGLPGGPGVPGAGVPEPGSVVVFVLTLALGRMRPGMMRQR